MHRLYLLLAVFLPCFVQAQLPSTRFFPKGNDPAYYVSGSCGMAGQTPDSGYYFMYNYGALGFETAGPQKGYLIHTDSLLNPLWEVDSPLGFGCMAMMPDGSALIRRSYNNNTVQRYSLNGLWQWSRVVTYGTETVQIESFLPTDTSVIMYGTLSSPVNLFGGYDYWNGMRLEIDTAGNLLSAQVMNIPMVNTTITAIAQDGSTEVLAGRLGMGVFITRQTGNAATSWTRSFSYGSACGISQLVILPDSSILLTGGYSPSALDPPYLILMRISATGTLLWAKTMPVPSPGNSLTPLANGNFALTGYHFPTQGDSLPMMLMEFTPAGIPVRTVKYQQKIITPPFALAGGNYLFAACTNEPNLFVSDSAFRPSCNFITPNLSLTALPLSLSTDTYSAVTFAPVVVGSSGYMMQQTLVVDTCALSPLYLGLAALNAPAAIRIFPNPATEQLTIDPAGERTATIELFDFNGRLVLTEQFTGGPASLSLEGLKPAAYLVRITGDDGQLLAKEVLVIQSE